MKGKRVLFRMVLIGIVGVAALSGIWAAGQNEPIAAEGDMPSISFMVLDYGRDKISEDLFVFDVMKEKIGVNVVPVPILEEGFNDKLNTMIAGGNLPDLLTVPYEAAQKYGPLGVFQNYKDSLTEKMPALDSLLQKYREVKNILPAEDGGFYSLPQISTQLDYDWVFGLRTDLLELQGKTAEEVKTLDDLYDYLAASKGLLEGLIEYPWIPVRPGEELLTVIPKYFGVGGTAALFYTDDGFVYGPATERFRIYIEFLSDLYHNQLVHPDFLGLSRNENKEMFWKGKSAFYSYPEYLIEGSYNDDLKRLSGNAAFDFTAVWPFEIDGEATAPRRAHALYSGGKWSKAINAEADNMDAVYKFVNYVYSEEGSNVFYIGEEGTHYTVSPSGSHVWLLNFGWNADAVGADAPSYVDFGLANVRYAFLRPYFPQKPSLDAVYYATLEKADQLADPAPIINLSLAESDEYANIMVTVSTFALENCAKFVTGRRPMSEWDSFVKDLEKLDVARAIEIYNKAAAK